MSDGSTQLSRVTTGAQRAIRQLECYEGMLRSAREVISQAGWSAAFVEVSQFNQEDTRPDKDSLVLTVMWVNDAAGERLRAVWKATTGSDGMGRSLGPELTWGSNDFCAPIATQSVSVILRIIDVWKARPVPTSPC